jgi:hypothetical protein
VTDVGTRWTGTWWWSSSWPSLAPSVHNTQPWSFTWDGVSLGVREDPARSLPVLDPSGRERIISCGAAVLHARLGFAERGWDVATAVLPSPTTPSCWRG